MMADNPTPTQYVVKAGDTLSKIASQYGVSTSAISGYKSGDANKIGIGETLSILGNSAPKVNTAPASALGTSAVTPAPSATSTAPNSLLGLTQQTVNNIATLTPKVGQGEADIKAVMGEIGKKGTERVNAYEKQGVNTAKKELDEITNTMRARQNAYNNAVDKIRNNNPTGALEGGQQIEIDRISKDHASEMADLAIVAEVKQGNFTTAKAIVDAKVDAETEDLKTQLSSLQFFYQQNYNSLDDQQKTLLQQQTNAVEEELATAKELRTQIGELQLAAAKNGAGAGVISAIGKAGTLEQAITLAGSSISDSSGGGGSFSKDQTNGGVALSGLSPQEFATLPYDVKNYFINNAASAKAYTQALSDIRNGDQDYNDFVEQLNQSYLSQPVKDYLLADLQKRVPQTAEDTGGGFWSSVGSFFKGVFNSGM